MPLLIRVYYSVLLMLPVCSVLIIKEIDGAKSSETLDPEGKYHVTWEVDKTGTIIIFEVTVETTGYVGFGISLTGSMKGSDIVIGGVLPDGSVYFQDRYAEHNGMPIIDDHQDWTLLRFSESNGFTYLKFSRKITTCDSQDIPITADAQRFIWAIGEDDNIKYHEAARGSLIQNILDPPTPEIDLSQYQSFDAVMNVTMPPSDTSYWCSVHRSPFFTTKHHTIAFGPKILSPIAKRHSHHLSFYQCKVPNGEDPEEFFESFIVPGGEDCFAGTSDRALKVYEFCTNAIYSWAIGAKIMHMPERVGFPISDGGREYFLLEIHLNNPGKESNISFQSGVEIYHTSDLRPIEAGKIAMGAATDWKLVIPPGSTNFYVAAHCASSCTQFIEPEGYTLFNVQLHAHKSARKMRLRHFRKNVELPWIADDQTYDNNFQNNRNIRPVKLLPGDHITLECGYDNTWVKPQGTVIGGYSTRDEMCASVIYYYPLGRFSICGSENFGSTLMSLLGINEISNADNINPKIISPLHLKGKRMQEYMNTVEWTSDLRNAVQNQLTVGPHDKLCILNGNQLPESLYNGGPLATYPGIDRVYQPVDQCLVKKMNTYPRLESRNKGNTQLTWRYSM